MTSTQIGIHIKSTADVGGIQQAEKATKALADETRQLENAAENTSQEMRQLEQSVDKLADELRQSAKATEQGTDRFWEFTKGTAASSEEVRKLAERTKAHAERLQEVMRVQREMGNTPDPFQAEGIVRAFERERYELEQRRAVSKADWMERQGYLKSERAERDTLRDVTIKQSQAERELKNSENWEKRRADMKEEQAARQRIREETIKQAQAERQSAREREQAWRNAMDIAKQLATTLIAATAAFAKEGYLEFAKLDDSVRQVATISREWQGDIEGLTQKTKSLAREWNVMPEIMAQTLYQAQSLGSQDIFTDAELAAKAAIAGNSEANKVLEAMLKTQNAFGRDMYTNEDILNIFFKTIENGALTMDDLAGGISAVTSVAGESGTRLEDVAAVLVTMTKQGDDFNEAVELSSLLLMQLGTEGTAAATAFKDASGESYRDFIAQGGTLAEAMQLLQDHADKLGKGLGEILGGSSPFFRDTQAARAAMELTGHHLVTLTENTEEMYNVAGVMDEAYQVMADSAQRDVDRMEVSWANLKVSAGEYVASLEIVQVGMTNVASAFEYLSGGTSYDLGQVIEENKAAYGSMEELTAEAQRLQTACVQADGWNEAENPIKARIEEIAIAQAGGVTTLEEYEAKLKEVFGDGVSIADYGFGEELSEVYIQLGDEVHSLGLAYDLMTEGVEYNAQAMESQKQDMEAQRQAAIEAARAMGSYADVMGDVDNEMAMMANSTHATNTALAQTVQQLGQVGKVLDGDTLRMEGGFDLRLMGVDTPETTKEWLGKAGMPFGKEAMRFTQEFLINPEVSFEEGGTDPHGRMLASVFNGDGASLEHELIARGLALPLPVHMTGDEELTAELEALARTAAEMGAGIFGDERVANAFLEGQIGDMEQLMAMYDELAAADAAYYSSYIGHINKTVESLEEMQAALAAAAVQKALLEGNMEAVPMILDMAVNMGLMTEEQAGLQQQYATSMMLIEEYAVTMGSMDEVTADATETMMLLATGLFSSAEQAEATAKALSGPAVDALYEAAQGAKTLEEAAIKAGIELSRIPSEVEVRITADTTGFSIPGMPSSTTATAFADGGLVTGGIAGRDSVPAMLTPGEFVVRASAAQAIGHDTLRQLNQVSNSTIAPQISFGGDTINVSGSNQFDTERAVSFRSQQKADTAADLLRRMGVRR